MYIVAYSFLSLPKTEVLLLTHTVISTVIRTDKIIRLPVFYTCLEFGFTPGRDSSIGIAVGYGVDDRCSRVLFSAGAGNYSRHHRVQNGSRAHPAFYPLSIRGSFPDGKAAGP